MPEIPPSLNFRDIDLQLQRLDAQHVEGGLELCRLAGWNQLAYDWQRLIRYEPLGCFALTSSGRVVATVTNTCYGDSLAWIGMMLVHPEFRRRGLATRLVQESLEYLREKRIRCVKLDATPAGQKVYERLGFELEWPFQRWALEGRPPSEGEPRSNESAERAWPAADEKQGVGGLNLELDLAAFGADRSSLLADLAPGSRTIHGDLAYGILRPGYLADYLGPVVSEHRSQAEQIIRTLVAGTDRTVFWDIPSPNRAAEQFARALGFQPVRDLTRMQIGRQSPAPEYNLQYAMFDPSVG